MQRQIFAQERGSTSSHAIQITQIQGQEFGFACALIVRVNLGNHRLCFLGGSARQKHMRALFDQGFCSDSTNSCIGTGDHGDLAL
jgi:hypothetical protein